MDEHMDDEILRDVRPDRRAFVKRVVGITAFAAPVVASYDLSSLTPAAGAVNVVSNISNQTVSHR